MSALLNIKFASSQLICVNLRWLKVDFFIAA